MRHVEVSQAVSRRKSGVKQKNKKDIGLPRPVPDDGGLIEPGLLRRLDRVEKSA
ncbi:hypothetical protein DPMN_139273 [Dreissena polymorpha]|uniref:Uncharacterized protein n=1 Tax=Dreissena polymorpha TaxID=45954 RepID=A0A9D4JGD2_DREPO|nr:hypothetical protein DPMN_139273 [Dreissena polymorpha]